MEHITFLDVLNVLKEQKQPRSAWGKGVKNFAEWLIEMQDNINQPIENVDKLEELLLNGAEDWEQFSYGGCAYIYDHDIARALCNPSELKRTKDGTNPPNSFENWLDVQARALYQACELIKDVFKSL